MPSPYGYKWSPTKHRNLYRDWTYKGCSSSPSSVGASHACRAIRQILICWSHDLRLYFLNLLGVRGWTPGCLMCLKKNTRVKKNKKATYDHNILVWTVLSHWQRPAVEPLFSAAPPPPKLLLRHFGSDVNSSQWAGSFGSAIYNDPKPPQRCMKSHIAKHEVVSRGHL